MSASRVTLKERGLRSSSIVTRMSAIRKLAVETTDNGLVAPEVVSRDAIHILKGVDTANASLCAGTRMLVKPHCCKAFRACSKTRYSEFSRLEKRTSDLSC